MTAPRALRVVVFLVLATTAIPPVAAADPVRPYPDFTGSPESVEYAVHASDVVVDGEILDASELEFAYQYRVTIQVTECIKGEAPAWLAFDIEIPQGARREFLSVRRGPFFLMNPATDSAPYTVRHPLDVLTGSYRAWFSAVEDLRPLRDRDELLAATRAATINVAGKTVELYLPGRDDHWNVTVPLTDALASRALKWAAHDDWRMRINAASVLSARTLNEAEPTLLALLRDSYVAPSGTARSYQRHYPVRAGAQLALAKLGTWHQAVVYEPDDLYVQLRWFHAAIVVAFVGILSFFAVQIRRSLLRVHRCWPARLLLDAWIVIVLLLLLTLVTSSYRADQIGFGIGGARYEITSHHRSLQLLRFPEWGSSTPLQFAGFPVGTDLDQAWDAGHLLETSRNSRLGVSVAHGLANAGVRTYLEWSAVTIRLWLPLLASMLLPTLSWFAAVVGWYRQARRRRCVHCGYDLRASLERCPECGHEIFGLRTRRRVEAMQAAQAQYQRELDEYHQHEARMLELLVTGQVDEDGRPVATTAGESRSTRGVDGDA